MKKLKPEKSRAKKKTEKKVSEIPDLAKAKRFEIIEKEKSGLPGEDLEDELDFNGIESSQDLRRLLGSSGFESMEIDNSDVPQLEKTVIFAPRISFQENHIEIEDRNYASTNYNEKYNDSKYAEKTPGYVAKKSEPSESKKGNK